MIPVRRFQYGRLHPWTSRVGKGPFLVPTHESCLRVPGGLNVERTYVTWEGFWSCACSRVRDRAVVYRSHSLVERRAERGNP
jgi:hypothetical protein